MYQSYSAKLLSSYPVGSFTLPELGWQVNKTDAYIYVVQHNLNITPTSRIKIYPIPLETSIDVTTANIEANQFVIRAQKNGDGYDGDFMFVLVVKD